MPQVASMTTTLHALIRAREPSCGGANPELLAKDEFSRA